MRLFRFSRMVARVAALLLLPLSTATAADALRLATTTSVENSGLLDYLLPDFERQCDCQVRVLPVGSGKALVLGRRGDIDVLITHAPEDERRFVREGYGVDRRPFMFNQFILLAPPDNPAGIKDGDTITTALAAIARHRSPFVSRGDDSGTHKKEQELWERTLRSGARVDFSEPWYISAGVGMGRAIVMADELQAYVLSDGGTYLHFREQVRLAQVGSPDSPSLTNHYSILRVNPERHPHTNDALAVRFVEWLTSEATRARINAYRVRGKPLFRATNP